MSNNDIVTKDQYDDAKKIISDYEDQELNKRIMEANLTKSRCCGRCDGHIDLCYADMN
jgi:hypothetical protein